MNNQHRNPNMGILNFDTGMHKFSISRHAPSNDLSFFIQHYWLITWDLREHPPYSQEVLQHPGVNVVFQRGHSYIRGIESRKSINVLQGEGQIVGVLFRPGAFHCYVQAPVSTLTDQTVNISDYFTLNVKAFEKELFSLEREEEKILLVEKLLRQSKPDYNATVDLLNEAIDEIIHNTEITKVEQLVEQFGIPKRTLQRWFNQYIGVSPKWVIRRYRMHEAIDRIERGMDLTQLAMDLGYFDQAHFSKDFKAAVGKSPTQYMNVKLSY